MNNSARLQYLHFLQYNFYTIVILQYFLKNPEREQKSFRNTVGFFFLFFVKKWLGNRSQQPKGEKGLLFCDLKKKKGNNSEAWYFD